MSIARRIRLALPLRWHPAARYHYEHWRGLEEREYALVCNAVRPGDLVADIGANFGVYTYGFARRGASVEAFEPQTECVAVLEAFAARSKSVRVHQLGLGAGTGAARLVAAGANRGSETRLRATGGASSAASAGTDVRVAALDDLDLGSFTLLKIDVEGGESDVLLGASRTIERDRPLVFVEIEQRHLDRPIADVFEFIESLGYEVEYLDATGKPRPSRDFDLERDQDVSALDGGNGIYINNFFLSHRAGERRWFG